MNTETLTEGYILYTAVKNENRKLAEYATEAEAFAAQDALTTPSLVTRFAPASHLPVRAVVNGEVRIKMQAAAFYGKACRS